MTDDAPDFERLRHWASTHEALYGYRARLVHDDALPDGLIVYRLHAVRMSRSTRAALEAWVDGQARLVWP